MKIITIATLSLILAAPAFAADPVSLIGTWKGEEYGVGVLDGWDRHELIIEVREQQGTAFKAVKSFGAPGAYETTDIYGSMTPDGRVLVVVDLRRLIRRLARRP